MKVLAIEYQLEIYHGRECILHIETEVPPPRMSTGDLIELNEGGGLITTPIKGRVGWVHHFICGTERSLIAQTRVHLAFD